CCDAPSIGRAATGDDRAIDVAQHATDGDERTDLVAGRVTACLGSDDNQAVYALFESFDRVAREGSDMQPEAAKILEALEVISRRTLGRDDDGRAGARHDVENLFYAGPVERNVDRPWRVGMIGQFRQRLR